MTLASGITVSLHYCGGKFKSISFFDIGVDESGCCGNKMKSKGCCDEKATFIKVKDNHHSSNTVNIVYNHFKILDAVLPINIFKFPKESNVAYCTLNYHAPPVLYDNPLYLKHRVLLI
ncbi:MAG: hypothetical protein HY062_06005 [Bacteroidetes bacterium]|nr:hypothetical protein [Bacteroidota bacterium]